MKTEVEELKESLSFTQNNIDQSFSNKIEKVHSPEKELTSTNEDVDESPRESWKECENKIYDLLKEKMEMNTSNVSIGRVHRVREKSKDEERAIVIQFLLDQDKANILRNCKKLEETKTSIFKTFSQETMQIRNEKWKEVLVSRKQGKISYLHYRRVICKEGRKPV